MLGPESRSFHIYEVLEVAILIDILDRLAFEFADVEFGSSGDRLLQYIAGTDKGQHED